jgi:hypothetical protein
VFIIQRVEVESDASHGANRKDSQNDGTNGRDGQTSEKAEPVMYKDRKRRTSPAASASAASVMMLAVAFSVVCLLLPCVLPSFFSDTPRRCGVASWERYFSCTGFRRRNSHFSMMLYHIIDFRLLLASPRQVQSFGFVVFTMDPRNATTEGSVSMSQ